MTIFDNMPINSVAIKRFAEPSISADGKKLEVFFPFDFDTQESCDEIAARLRKKYVGCDIQFTVADVITADFCYSQLLNDADAPLCVDADIRIRADDPLFIPPVLHFSQIPLTDEEKVAIIAKGNDGLKNYNVWGFETVNELFSAYREYMQYKAEWISTHISEAVKRETERRYYADPVLSDVMGFDKYVAEYGYSNGECYACFSEFVDNEMETCKDELEY